MRQLVSKYDGECAKCGKLIEVGQQAMYEKSTGIFCMGCEPKDVEEIRDFRTRKAERKAARYEEWAEKREVKANADLNSHPEYRHDWAFITQPGHIPARARMNAADNRAYESLNKAKEMRERAAGILNVRVAGDAERKRQAGREESDKVFTVGSRVFDYSGGNGEIVKVCKKNYKVKFDRGFTWLVDKSWIRPAKEQATA